MRTVFADTSYWIALASPKDGWHEKAATISKALQPLRLITTDEVLVEFLTFFSSFGKLRAHAAQVARKIMANPNVEFSHRLASRSTLEFASTNNARTRSTASRIASQWRRCALVA